MTALVVFHASILYNHFVDGRLGDPAVAFRWAIGGAVGRPSGRVPSDGRPARPGTPRARCLGTRCAAACERSADGHGLRSSTLLPEDAAAVLVVLPAAAPILLGTLLLLAFALVSATLAAPDLRRAWLAHDADARVAADPPVPLLAPRAPPSLSSDLTCRRSACRTRSVNGLTARATAIFTTGADRRN